MKPCQNCGEELEVNVEVCPNCGAYVSRDSNITDSNGLLQDKSPEEEFLTGKGFNEALENQPDESIPKDEIDQMELEAERRKFGKSTE